MEHDAQNVAIHAHIKHFKIGDFFTIMVDILTSGDLYMTPH